MRHLYDNNVVLQTETRVRVEANYNRTILGMTRPGEVIFYKAPSDPAEHPMYVDAEGRIVPVDPDTLQPMQNGSGKVVDESGAELPAYETFSGTPHIDDVRVAVTSAGYDIKDQDDKDIYVAYDGEIIPTGDHGVPNTTLVGGVPWVIGNDGEPYAPLSKVYPLKSYVNPVRGENAPMSKAGAFQTRPTEPYPDYFDINAIVKADRPSKRGVLLAWATPDEHGTPIYTGVHGYDKARYYTASKDRIYKYWTSPGTSDATGVLSGSTIGVFDNSWTVSGGSNKASSTNMVSADFQIFNMLETNHYFEKGFNLDYDASYEMSFDVLAQSDARVTIQMLQWSDNETTPGNGSFLGTTTLATKYVVGGGSTNFTVDLVPAAFSRSHLIRVIVQRAGTVATPKITLSNLSLKVVSYPISGVGPRAVYDRPINANKIVIGVDYSVDETQEGQDSHTNKPSDHLVRVYVDRGDGVFQWQTIATNPYIDGDGKITLYYNGSWGDEIDYDASTPIMGVQYSIYGMKRRDARVNITEISARRTYDVSEFLTDYSVDSEVSQDSFVLPFGAVNSNTGSVTLSNTDGRFNYRNRYLLDRERSADAGEPVFTDIPNPFYQMLGQSVEVQIETATFAPGDTERQFLRMMTANTVEEPEVGSDMDATLRLKDNAHLLSGIFPNQIFYSGPAMSVIQALYMLLDSVGFTSVEFAEEDEHFATHLQYFWTAKEDKSVWEIIEDICISTQTVAFFDEYNVLRFKSLKGLYEDALSKPPVQHLTSESSAYMLSNIEEMSLQDIVAVNKIKLNYRHIAPPEKTPSGANPMAVVWEPEGTEVIRAAPILNDLTAVIPSKGGSAFFTIPGDSAKTWPFSGMVVVEGERIKYDAKEYSYYNSRNVVNKKYITTDDERKELDAVNPDYALNNTYTGKIRISERGAEGTRPTAHATNKLTDFTRRYRKGTGTTINGYTKGLSIKNSKLIMAANPDADGSAYTTVTDGSWYDTQPQHVGTQFKITEGAHAGVCIGVSNPNDDGIFIELSTTSEIEYGGRPFNEFHVTVRKNGLLKHYRPGVLVPVSKNKTYTMDVSIKDGGFNTSAVIYTKYYSVVLRYGDKGNNVKVLQQALNRKGEKLTVDGLFGTATRAAVLRLQKKNSLTQDAIVRIEEWKALEINLYDPNIIAINATVDGTHTLNIQIPKSELNTGWDSGRHGVFTRARTTAEFEYMYAVRGGEDIEFDESMFYDYVSGGYVSDQLDAGWKFDTKRKFVTPNAQRDVVVNQLYIEDFGAWAHEIKDYDIVFEDEVPALSSFPYFSNEPQVHLTDYTHRPFGAKMRLVNRARHDAILNGSDAVTFGPEDEIDQKMMIYGHVLDVKDERSVTITDEHSVAARGAEEMSIDVDWVQSEASARKLGSHIVEAMSQSVPSFTMDVFGHAGLRVGQMVSIYYPQKGVGNEADPMNSNRFFITKINQSNDGSQKTSLSVREVIGSGGLRNARLADVLAANNNAMNINPSIEGYVKDGTLYKPAGYDFRGGLDYGYVSGTTSTLGGGAAKLTAKGSTPYESMMYANPYPDGVGRFAHNFGHHYLLTAHVYASHNVAVALVIEGWPTTGSMVKVLASKVVKLKGGQSQRITLKGQFLSDGSIPELEVGLRMLNPDNYSAGAQEGKVILVNDMYFRSDQNEAGIYPLHGGKKFVTI